MEIPSSLIDYLSMFSNKPISLGNVPVTNSSPNSCSEMRDAGNNPTSVGIVPDSGQSAMIICSILGKFTSSAEM